MSTPDEAWSVSRLARVIKRQVEEGMEPVWVRGELVGVKRYPSGHWYFGLRDEAAKVDCTLWKGVASRLTGPLEEGQEVFALGTANVWEERTALRFNVTRIVTAAGLGAAAQQVERTKQALLKDGLLDPARKRPLPRFPLRIAVITSIAGAAVHDIITVATRRWPGVELFVVNSAVQGDAAPAELVAALETVGRLDAIDCCIIGRGGGAREDLAAFNDEAVCRAIAACPVPVISAVGHEVDVTLADLVADLRAATPSQAAEFALPDRREVQARLNGLGAVLAAQGMGHVTAAQQRDSIAPGTGWGVRCSISCGVPSAGCCRCMVGCHSHLSVTPGCHASGSRRCRLGWRPRWNAAWPGSGRGSAAWPDSSMPCRRWRCSAAAMRWHATPTGGYSVDRLISRPGPDSP
ncbi:MAG: exodeoxyribonuclease VII large subunit [Gemmatimonadetes bacterium]|nr:exodeoxyribonuclease VII large subunit [Gemmatimonadota bacterium]